VPDLQLGGCRFKSQLGLLHTKVYSAFHPFRISQWVPAVAGKAKAGIAHSACRWNTGCAVISLTMCAIPERLKRCFVWRHYTNRLPLRVLYVLAVLDKLILNIDKSMSHISTCCHLSLHAFSWDRRYVMRYETKISWLDPTNQWSVQLISISVSYPGFLEGKQQCRNHVAWVCAAVVEWTESAHSLLSRMNRNRTPNNNII